jgi:RNA polymerase sigma-70 factor (ECF subfamily)
MYNLAYRILGNASDAEDLTQDVFLQILRKLQTFRGESAFSTWLYRVAINLCKDHLRRQKVTLPLTADPPNAPIETEPSDAISVIENLELRMSIERALSLLPEEFRLTVVLHDVQGYKYEKIAEILDISVGTVKSRLNRARHRLAEMLLQKGTIEDAAASKL